MENNKTTPQKQIPFSLRNKDVPNWICSKQLRMENRKKAHALINFNSQTKTYDGILMMDKKFVLLNDIV